MQLLRHLLYSAYTRLASAPTTLGSAIYQHSSSCMQQCQAHPKGDTAGEHNQQRHHLRACSKCKPEAVDIPGSPNTQRRCSWQDDPPSVNALVPQCDTQTEQPPKKIPGEHNTLNVLAGSVQHNHNMCSRAKKAHQHYGLHQHRKHNCHCSHLVAQLFAVCLPAARTKRCCAWMYKAHQCAMPRCCMMASRCVPPCRAYKAMLRSTPVCQVHHTRLCVVEHQHCLVMPWAVRGMRLGLSGRCSASH
jgi:hypothetical protein